MLIIYVHIFYFWYSQFWNPAAAGRDNLAYHIWPTGGQLMSKGLYWSASVQSSRNTTRVSSSCPRSFQARKKNRHPKGPGLVLIHKNDSGRLTAEPRPELFSEKVGQRRHFSQDPSPVTTIINTGRIPLKYKYHPLVSWTSRETFSNSTISVSCFREHPECSES